MIIMTFAEARVPASEARGEIAARGRARWAGGVTQSRASVISKGEVESTSQRSSPWLIALSLSLSLGCRDTSHVRRRTYASFRPPCASGLGALANLSAIACPSTTLQHAKAQSKTSQSFSEALIGVPLHWSWHFFSLRENYEREYAQDSLERHSFASCRAM